MSGIDNCPSKSLRSLLCDNEDFLPSQDLPTALNSPVVCLTTYRDRLEHFTSQLDQRIHPSCVLLTPEIDRQQELLEVSASDFVTLCHEIESKYLVDEAQTSIASSLVSVAELILSKVRECSQLIKSAKPPATSSTPIDRRVNILIERTLLSLQSLQCVDGPDTKGDMLEHLMNSTANLASKSVPNLMKVNSQLRNLTSHLSNESFNVQVAYMCCVKPLIGSLVDAVQIRLKHLWGLLFIWVSIGEFLSQVTFHLLNDGFCKPPALSKAAAASGGASGESDSNEAGDGKEQEGGGGCTSLSAEGVDASGAKDVSDQLESQEQIEGTQNQQKEERNDDDEAPEDSDAQGIEMPDDFDGAFGDDKNPHANDTEETEQDEKDEEDLNGIDEQMGDASDEPEKLNDEMWASEDEEDKEEEEESHDNADSKSGGVDNKTGKSKQSKSTANDKSAGEEDKGDPEDADNDDQKVNDVDKNETVAGTDTPKEQAQASGQETVAGDENENNSEETGQQQEEMKKDEANLAGQEAERIDAEENEEPNQTEDVVDEFTENMEIEPDSNEFEDLNEGKLVIAYDYYLI